MTTSYSWSVAQLECAPSMDGKVDVVTTVHWRVAAATGSLVAEAYGSVAVPVELDVGFIPYNQLTEEDVITWVKDALGSERVDAITHALDTQLSAIQNPTVVVKPAPWSTT